MSDCYVCKRPGTAKMVKLTPERSLEVDLCPKHNKIVFERNFSREIPQNVKSTSVF